MDFVNDSGLVFLLEKYFKGNISAIEKEKLFDQISQKDNERVVKGHMLSQLESFEVTGKLMGKTESAEVFSKILAELKLEKTTPPRTMTSFNKQRIRRLAVRASGIAALIVVSFMLGNFFGMKKRGEVVGIQQISYNEIKAPLGSQSEVTLPDGSSVKLNAGSTIKYRSDYNTADREVMLHGEAYFKVAKNPDLPLYVKAGNISIMAVGTEFNIKAYDDEELIETTLVEGKVKITMGNSDGLNGNSIDLNPNQKAIYYKETNSFSLNGIERTDPAEPVPTKTIYDNILISPKVDVNQVAAWTEGKLVIKGEALESLCLKLQRKYDVSFAFNNEEIRKYRFSGTLLDETLEQVLDAIMLTAPISYTVTGKNVYLSTDLEKWNDFSKHMNVKEP